MSRCVMESKTFTKNVLLLCSGSVDTIGPITAHRLCYHDLNQSKTVKQIKMQNISCCGKTSCIVMIVQLGDFI